MSRRALRASPRRREHTFAVARPGIGSPPWDPVAGRGPALVLALLVARQRGGGAGGCRGRAAGAARRPARRAAATCRPSGGARAGRSTPRCGPASYGPLLLGLVVALVLGLTPLGARLVERSAGRSAGTGWPRRCSAGFARGVHRRAASRCRWPPGGRRSCAGTGCPPRPGRGWTVDLLKGYAVGAVIGAVALLGFFGVARLPPRWWWAAVAAGAAGLTVLLSFVFPVLVEPMFNKFTPMPDGPLRDRADRRCADRDGVPVRDVLVADASRRTTALNAYVSGLGPTRRIVVYDTLLREAPAGRGRGSVVAHELGHAKDRDVLTGTAARGAGRGRRGRARCTCSARGRRCCAGPASTRSPTRARSRCCSRWPRWPAWSPRRCRALVSRRIEARADAHALRADRRPVHVEAMERPAGHGQPGRRRPAPAGVPHVRQPPVHGGADGGRPRVRAGRAVTGRCWSPTTSRPARAASSSSCTTWRYASPPDSVVVYASTLARCREVRRRPAVPGDPGGHRGAAADPGGGPAGGASSPARTAATRSGSAPPPRSGCSPAGCASGPGSAARWR